MLALRLPVSGAEVVLGVPDGASDLLVAEASTCDLELGVAWLDALARTGGGWTFADLPLTDLDWAMLCARGRLFGDRVRGDVVCACGERVDLGFQLVDYLAHHQPRPADGVDVIRPGAWRLAAHAVEFRAPTVRDVLAAGGDERVLALRCGASSAAGEPTAPDVTAAIESALDVVAPSLDGALEGACPSCGGTVHTLFEPQTFVLHEVRQRALAIYAEVDLLASRYHWSEAHILGLPGPRRARYVEAARGVAP